MVGLSLGDRFVEVIGTGGTQERFPLDWLWRDDSGPFCVGEFQSTMLSDLPALRSFWMTANARIGARTVLSEEDAIALAEYDPSWPAQFEDMADWLRGILPGGVDHIVHYGSTSVPGMPAKPVIDILVGAPSFEDARRCLIPALNRDCWEYWWYGDHMIFIKRERLNGPRAHHVHVAPPGHRLWEGLAFRDYLVAHPDTAREYAALKRELAQQYRNDREKYTYAKTAFIGAVTRRALAGGHQELGLSVLQGCPWDRS